jgi:hypothetical protein
MNSGILLTRIWRHRYGEQAERQDLTFWNGVGLGNESVTRDGIKCLREAMDYAQTPKSQTLKRHRTKSRTLKGEGDIHGNSSR